MRIASILAVLAPSLLSLAIACGDDDGGGDSDDGSDDSADDGDGGDDDGALDASPGQDSGGGSDGSTDVIFCGGLLGLTCDDDLYCDYADETCGDGDFQGECKPRPTFCDIGEEVCGCDTQLHSSACAAAMIGVDVADPSRCQGVTPGR
jgi:hypothetical protein